MSMNKDVGCEYKYNAVLSDWLIFLGIIYPYIIHNYTRELNRNNKKKYTYCDNGK